MTKPKKPVDLSEFRIAPKVNGVPCGITRAVKGLTEKGELEKVEQLQAALIDDSITHVAIYLVLKDWGYQVSKETPGRHRRGLCACPTTTI